MTEGLIDQTAVLTIVYEAIDVLNQQRPASEQLIKSPDMILAADGGPLDSLQLSTLVLTVERKIKQLSGVDVDIFSADIYENMTKLRTPTSIVEAILEQIP